MHAITSDFVFAGNAVFTVASPVKHFTFRVRQPKKDGAPAPHFLQVLTGPDNTRDFTYLGILRRDATVTLTKASPCTKQDVRVQVAEWAVRQLLAGKPLPAGYAIHHEGRCCRCGRVLTTPQSVTAGIGPECASKAA